ncbi:MAG: sulfotransferase [Sandaracinaceae bacterium]
MNRRLVAIAGAGHSGSTLLGLVLGSHPSVVYAGEAKKSRFLGDPKKPLRKRVCKLCGPDCPVWSRIEARPAPDVYEALSRLTGAPTVVDSTKDPAWIREGRRLADRAGIAHRLLFLQRDGRAVVNSRLRKDRGADPDDLIRRWRARIEATRALVAEHPDRSLEVRYEALATEPRATVRRICAFLGLDFDERMLSYEAADHHPLGGNTGTQSVVARAAGLPDTLAEVPDRSRSYYQPLRRGFRLDLRWRDELPGAVRARFEELAGEVNAPFRWEVGGP